MKKNAPVTAIDFAVKDASLIIVFTSGRSPVAYTSNPSLVAAWVEAEVSEETDNAGLFSDFKPSSLSCFSDDEDGRSELSSGCADVGFAD